MTISKKCCPIITFGELDNVNKYLHQIIQQTAKILMNFCTADTVQQAKKLTHTQSEDLVVWSSVQAFNSLEVIPNRVV